jgi:Kef-type K+ transport system membrane component KefB
MVGAFLSGVILDIDWYKSTKIDALRGYILILLMPIFFLSTGLKTDWGIAHYFVIFASLVLFIAQFSGKLIGTMLAGLLLNWKKGEASIVAGLLQTKALIEIIFANILLDKDIISNQMFTALLFMALISTIFTMPFVAPRIKKFKAI